MDTTAALSVPDSLLAFLQSYLAGGFLEPSGVDLAHDAVEIDRRLDALEVPGELDIRVQLARLVERPYFLAVISGQKLGRKSPEEPSQIVHVANQHARRVVVARRVHGLRQVDDHGPVRAQENVELAQVAVDPKSVV